jgi:Protein of unknown function, DUF488
MALPFFTIGHSTRSIDEFVDLLSNAEVRLVIDVRTIPRSRTNPQYNSEALAEALSESRIDYAHCDLIFAAGPYAVQALTKATSTIPLVAIDLESDPVANRWNPLPSDAGLLKNVQRPVWAW